MIKELTNYGFEERDDPRTWGFYAPKQTKPDVARLQELKKPEHYWRYALELLELWVSYQTKRKLVMNAPKIRVNLDWNALKDARDALLVAVETEIAIFKIVCKNFGVEPVNLKWLESTLTEAKAYKRARVALKRQASLRATPVALSEIV